MAIGRPMGTGRPSSASSATVDAGGDVAATRSDRSSWPGRRRAGTAASLRGERPVERLAAADHDVTQRITRGKARLEQQGTQDGGHRLQHGDAVLADRVDEVGAVLLAAGAGEDHRCANGQWREELPHRGVEGESGLLQHAVRGAQADALEHPQHAVADAAVRDHGALGLAGGAGGVDDVGEVLGAGQRRGAVVGQRGAEGEPVVGRPGRGPGRGSRPRAGGRAGPAG